MNLLFGDASTAMGTPSVRAESEALLAPGSPTDPGSTVGYRAHIGGRLGPSNAIPGLALDPPDVEVDGDVGGKRGAEGGTESDGGGGAGIGGWFARMVGRARGGGGGGSSGRGGSYAPLQQHGGE